MSTERYRVPYRVSRVLCVYLMITKSKFSFVTQYGAFKFKPLTTKQTFFFDYLLRYHNKENFYIMSSFLQ